MYVNEGRPFLRASSIIRKNWLSGRRFDPLLLLLRLFERRLERFDTPFERVRLGDLDRRVRLDVRLREAIVLYN